MHTHGDCDTDMHMHLILGIFLLCPAARIIYVWLHYLQHARLPDSSHIITVIN